ncbi:GNAT family N-acetyltransferase [Streptomyces sp. VRA16 Mangrove soil]|uniref:GNAT family N-acetyltransferase n=1 Tax=Streptomyces sp. VRA16 Mangrove soil TaxID=2817434 RepID=UPI001A9E6644|nr:GNAT family N-acetyltransferase [Streptomyces sp. VRA16 Mangrove soil]MBO1336098.1 GNAT family N-acetyltransferase [Streptomyces sp. VRA16 Mangrove soil]
MTVTVRVARPADFGRLGELSAAAYLDSGLLAFGESDWYAGELRDVARRAREAEVLVAVGPGGEILGGVTYVPSHDHPYAEVARAGEAEFRMLAVAAEARGKGAGEALVRAVIERARAAARTAVVLSTQPVATASHRLYERVGFRRAPERDWAPVPEVTLIGYELRLTEAADATGLTD